VIALYGLYLNVIKCECVTKVLINPIIRNRTRHFVARTFLHVTFFPKIVRPNLYKHTKVFPRSRGGQSAVPKIYYLLLTSRFSALVKRIILSQFHLLCILAFCILTFHLIIIPQMTLRFRMKPLFRCYEQISRAFLISSMRARSTCSAHCIVLHLMSELLVRGSVTSWSLVVDATGLLRQNIWLIYQLAFRISS
jgi:hypothetical protein